MTNEDYIEEMFHIAHKCGVLNEFHNKVTEIHVKQRTPLVTAVPIAFRAFKQEGLIVED
jgi:hypothetical protein